MQQPCPTCLPGSRTIGKPQTAQSTPSNDFGLPSSCSTTTSLAPISTMAAESSGKQRHHQPTAATTQAGTETATAATTTATMTATTSTGLNPAFKDFVMQGCGRKRFGATVTLPVAHTHISVLAYVGKEWFLLWRSGASASAFIILFLQLLR